MFNIIVTTNWRLVFYNNARVCQDDLIPSVFHMPYNDIAAILTPSQLP